MFPKNLFHTMWLVVGVATFVSCTKNEESTNVSVAAKANKPSTAKKEPTQKSANTVAEPIQKAKKEFTAEDYMANSRPCEASDFAQANCKITKDEVANFKCLAEWKEFPNLPRACLYYSLSVLYGGIYESCIVPNPATASCSGDPIKRLECIGEQKPLKGCSKYHKVFTVGAKSVDEQMRKR